MIRGAREFREGKVSGVEGLRAVDRLYRSRYSHHRGSFTLFLSPSSRSATPRSFLLTWRNRRGGFWHSTRRHRRLQVLAAGNGARRSRSSPTRTTTGRSSALARCLIGSSRGVERPGSAGSSSKGNLEESPVPPVCRSKVGNPRYLHVQRPTFSVRPYGFQHAVQAAPATCGSDGHHACAGPGADPRRRSSRDGVQAARSILPRGCAGPQPEPSRHLPQRPGAGPGAAPRGGGILTAAGIPVIPIWSSVSEPADRERVSDAIKTQLRAIGIHGRPTSRRTGRRSRSDPRRGSAADVPLCVARGAARIRTAFFQLFHSRSPRNPTGYANPVVDALLVQASPGERPPRRKEIYQRAEPLILEEAPGDPGMALRLRAALPGLRPCNVEVSGSRQRPISRSARSGLEGPRGDRAPPPPPPRPPAGLTQARFLAGLRADLPGGDGGRHRGGGVPAARRRSSTRCFAAGEVITQAISPPSPPPRSSSTASPISSRMWTGSGPTRTWSTPSSWTPRARVAAHSRRPELVGSEARGPAGRRAAETDVLLVQETGWPEPPRGRVRLRGPDSGRRAAAGGTARVGLSKRRMEA